MSAFLLSVLFDPIKMVEEYKFWLHVSYDTECGTLRMAEKILGPSNLRRCSLRRGSATNCLVAKDSLQRLVLAFSRYTMSVLDWSKRSETVGTTHAVPISGTADDIRSR